MALFLDGFFRLGIAHKGVAGGDLARNGLHAAGRAGVQRGLHKSGVPVVFGLERCALGDHAQFCVVVNDRLADADIANADLAGHVAGNAAENQPVNAVFCAKHLHGGGGVGLAHARTADNDLLAVQGAAVVFHPGVLLLGYIFQPGTQLIHFIGHSAHNANNHLEFS